MLTQPGSTAVLASITLLTSYGETVYVMETYAVSYEIV